ncbi:MAG: peptidoglycan hydrolase CwlO-like protein [Flavobacteriales bacterium]|jgi:peptidoglycan hydrolase CwlO-like protein|tara:strand:+ start:383 stop:673 length:291 start_codon:yes stop_codon:yes gene_type:complete
MNRLSTKLTNLRSQVQKLNSLFDQLKLKNVDLERENQELHEKLERKIDRIKALKQERDLIINAKSLTEVGLSSSEARQKVNELIRGIDKCIAQLNQ